MFPRTGTGNCCVCALEEKNWCVVTHEAKYEKMNYTLVE
jgi:hypothetical protein